MNENTETPGKQDHGRIFQRVAGKTIFLRHSLLPGDLGRIITFHAELYHREHGLGPLFEGYVAKTMGDFAAHRRSPDTGEYADGSSKRERIWLLSEENSTDLVGCCAIIDGGENRAQFRWFLLEPRYRGAGLGRKLLQDAVDFARMGGYEEVFLLTGDFLPPAGRLYHSMGFRITEEHPFDGWEVPNNEQKYVLSLK